MRVIRGAADIWSECKSIQNGREPRGYGKDSIEKQLWPVPNRLPTAALDSSNRPVTSRDPTYFNIFKINLKRCNMILKIERGTRQLLVLSGSTTSTRGNLNAEEDRSEF